ncbi:hypothetical protein [Micromonospora tarensis]|nr:hypothetical protein [Micromonospora tarensis]
MDTWQQPAITYSGTTASSMINSVDWKTLDSQGIDSRLDGFEFGWESLYSGGLAEDNAYWVEYDGVSYEYYNLSGMPGASDADGRAHTYMVMPGENSQLALYIDFNFAANTTKAESTRIGESSGGLYAQTIEAASFAGSFEHRMQMLDGNHVWRRPWVAETSTREIYPCGAPRNAPATGGPNTPPRCLDATAVAKAGTNPATVDYFKLSKPSLQSAQNPPSSARGIEVGDIYNGVDQRLLAECMASDPSRCMNSVPGLAECIAAHSVCNTTAKQARGGRHGVSKTTITEQQALALTRKSVVVPVGSLLASVKARTIPAQAYVNARGVSALSGAEGDVILVSGAGPVQGLLGRQTGLYHGYRLAFDSASGSLLHACLGATCSDIS